MVKCDICDAVLLNNKSLQRHNLQFHRTSSCLPTLECGACNDRFRTNVQLESHITEKHDVPIVHEKSSFVNEDEFNNWRWSVEAEYKAKYVRSRFHKQPGKTVAYYICNRSGQPRLSVSDETRKRRLKFKGSRKVGSHCPSRIIATYYDNGSVTVDFCKTHFGHAPELEHLPVPSSVKKEIATKIAAKIPLSEILNEVKQSAANAQDELQPEHLMTDQDLRNIRKQLSLEGRPSLNHLKMADPHIEDILVNKKKTLSVSELSALSKEELVDKVVQLQAHNIQLRNIIAKKIAPPCDAVGKERPFDFSKCPKMHIFLRVLYLGWNYQGFACQEDSNETIEFYLMKALLKCKMIESRDTSNYHRCGRTDKGVSSFGQVISLTVRAAEPGKSPLMYCKMLNRLLPNDIRAVAWRAATEESSARFDCKSRSYKYYFPKSTLNLAVMNDAAKHLVGTHDFRNICKMDVGNGVTTFVRNITDATVSTINDDERGYQMCELSIVGNAFLWHQVRCIASLILLVGQGLEDPSIVRDLLDVEKNPRKPQYVLACPESLNLFKCDYEFDDWNIDEEEIEQVIETLQRLWTDNQVKSVHLRTMLNELEPLAKREVNGQISSILRRESKNYKPLLTRHKCQSLEDRIDHYAKKRRVDEKM